MKYLLVAFSMVLSGLSWQASAAPIDLGLITDTQTFESNNLKGEFEYTYTFTVAENTAASALIGNNFTIASQKIANFKAILDDTLSFGSAINVANNQILTKNFDSLSTAITHTLTISGKALSLTGYVGHITLAVPTPIPAMVWLFGSAFVSLVSIRRRKV